MASSQQISNVWATNIVLCGLAAFGIFSTSIYLPSLPALVHEFQTDQASVQLTLTLFFLGASIGPLFLGPLSDHFGRRKVAHYGIAVFMLATIAGTFTDSIGMFIVWRFIQGLASSTGPLLSRAIARDLFTGEALTRTLSRVMMVISISPAVAPVIGGYLQVTFGWEYAFYFLSLMAGIVLFLFITFIPETNLTLRQNDINPYRVMCSYLHLFKNRNFLCYALCLAGIFAGLFTFITMSPFIFQKQFGWAPEEYAWVSAMVTVGNVMGFATANRLTGKATPNRLIVLSLICTILSTLYLVGVSAYGSVNDLMVLLFIILFLAFSSVAIANCASSAMQLHPKAAGLASAVIGSIQIGSGAVGSAIAGFVEDTPLTLGLCMGGLAVFALLVFLLPRD